MSVDGVMRVMVSSTSLDLPEHRAEAVDACLRMDAKPEAMEHLGAGDESAVGVSLAMVDRADVYVGILGWRY
ncbi:MAG: DUF4062 domain-containing protein, partial [bacterium]|nr:DUF4062 domain-containing protein [bacterium]